MLKIFLLSFIFLYAEARAIFNPQELGKNNLPKRASISLKESKPSSFLIGTIAGGTEALINHPLWVMKTHAQAGFKSEVTSRTVYNGVLPSASTMAILTGVRFLMKQYIEDACYAAKYSVATSEFLSSYASGSISSLVTNPLELGLTQQQKSLKKVGWIATMLQIKNTHGYSRCFVSLPNTAIRDGIYTIGFLYLPYKLSSIMGSNDEYFFLATLMGGGISAIASHPFDTVKTWRQLKADERLVPSSVSVLQSMHNTGVTKELFKGVWIRGFRIVSGITIITYSVEALKKHLSPKNVK